MREERKREIGWEKGEGCLPLYSGEGEAYPLAKPCGTNPTWVADQGGAAAPPHGPQLAHVGFPTFFLFFPPNFPLMGQISPEGPLVE